MPSLTSFHSGGQKVRDFAEPLDEFALLKSWCAEVERPDSDFAFLEEFANEHVQYINMNGGEASSGEPMEIGAPKSRETGQIQKGFDSNDSLQGHDTTNPTFGHVSVTHDQRKSRLESWSTASINSSYLQAVTPQNQPRPRSDPCLPEISADRVAASFNRQESGITTFMLRNIPNRVKVEDIQDRICALGFGETYDFLYMPLDLQSKQNKGYAFVNLINERVAAEFAERFNGTRFEGRLSTKEVLVCEATAQGVVPTLRTIKHSNWSKKEHMPIVRVEGKLMHLTPLAACEILRIKAQYG
jgi:hypothetical protein